MSKKIIRAIDGGYGWFKFTRDVKDNGEIETYTFPSIATIASDKNQGGGFLKDRRTINVMHKNVLYEVGVDAILNADGHSKKVLNSNYIDSNEYAALMKGALKLMNLREIDLLVLGTPVMNYDQTKGLLKKSWTGDIELDGEKSVTIKQVKVYPQPLGGLAYSFKESGQKQEYMYQRNLIIDPGYYTLDWLITQDMKIAKGSGSYQGGMYFYMKAIVDQLGPNSNSLVTFKKLDDYFMKNKPFNYAGNEHDINQYLPVANSVIELAIQEMLNQITDIDNIENIILIGGASAIYLPFLKKHLKGRIINDSKGKAFSNVLGFHAIGESFSSSKN